MGAMWQMQIFWGFTPDHECINNGTDYILKPCGIGNGTSCDYVMHSSYVTDFELFCNDAKYLKFIQSAMLFGSFFGELLLGWFKDIVGRRKTILLTIVTLAASLAGIVLSPKLGSWKYLMLFCTVAGFSSGAQVKMTLPTEIFGTKERFVIGPIIAFAWSLSTFLYLATSYLFRDWNISAIISFTPIWISAIAYWFFIPESGRWLHSRDRTEEALIEFRKMAKWNGTVLSKQLEETLVAIKSSEIDEKSVSLIGSLKKHKIVMYRYILLVTSQ